MDLANVQLPPRSHANVAASRSNEGRAITAVVFVHNVLQRRSPQPAVTLCSIGHAAVAGLTCDAVRFTERVKLSGAFCALRLTATDQLLPTTYFDRRFK